MTPAELTAFFRRAFAASGAGYEVVAVPPDGAVVRFVPTEAHLRPGGTVSGPTLMTAVDMATYAALLGKLGPGAEGAVTSSASVHFLGRPRVAPLEIAATLLKVGRRLAVSAVEVRSLDGELLAHATVTYALPEGAAR